MSASTLRRASSRCPRYRARPGRTPLGRLAPARIRESTAFTPHVAGAEVAGGRRPVVDTAGVKRRMFAPRIGGTTDAPEMVMLMPSMSRYMTRQPWTIRKDAKMSQAHELMRGHRIRHLPVLEDGKLVGIVSDRDLHLMETLPDSDPDEITVDEAMTED